MTEDPVVRELRLLRSKVDETHDAIIGVRSDLDHHIVRLDHRITALETRHDNLVRFAWGGPGEHGAKTEITLLKTKLTEQEARRAPWEKASITALMVLIVERAWHYFTGGGAP